MNAIIGLKNIVQNVPYIPGVYLSKIPHRYRLAHYSSYAELVNKVEQFSEDERLSYILMHLEKIVQYAQKNFSFYKELYGEELLKIKSIEDFENLPIISKKQVREFTKTSHGTFLLNTGGSSGEPLSFFMDKNAWAREWAHMHYIWSKVGYQPTDLMVTLLGKNIGDKSYSYNPIHNEFKLNPYKSSKTIIKDFKYLFKTKPIKYFQGYPSSIYNFFKELESELTCYEKKEFVKNIRCCLLSSEYPLPYMVKYLKENWDLTFISWYGHSEMCVLAYDENLSGEYKPLISYGYAEEVNDVLVGTSFHNTDMPLIRYSTDDVVKPFRDENGILKTFKITKGRSGDFIEDLNSKKISLTSFIFGRHHKIFEIADFVQIKQYTKGIATIFVVCKKKSVSEVDLERYFDLSNIQIKFDFKIVNEPFLTQAGKFKLKI